MKNVVCIKSVTLGATGDSYEAGQTYTIKDAPFRDYGEYFQEVEGGEAPAEEATEEKAEETEENKVAETAEDK